MKAAWTSIVAIGSSNHYSSYPSALLSWPLDFHLATTCLMGLSWCHNCTQIDQEQVAVWKSHAQYHICAVALEVAPIDVLSYHHVPSVLWTYCPMTTSPIALMPSQVCPITNCPVTFLSYRHQSYRSTALSSPVPSSDSLPGLSLLSPITGIGIVWRSCHHR